MVRKKMNLAEALQNANNGKTESSQVINPEKETTVISPGRQGKKAISGFFEPEVSKQLKKLALEEDKTVQALLAEALNDLFVKYNQKPLT